MLRLLTSVLLSTLIKFSAVSVCEQWIGTLNSVCIYETERDKNREYEYMSMKEFCVFCFFCTCPQIVMQTSKYTLVDQQLVLWRFPGGSDSRESVCNEGDLGWEDPLEKEMATHSTILPGDSMDRGGWQAVVHGVTKSWTQLGG